MRLCSCAVGRRCLSFPACFFFLSLFCPLHLISMRKSSALETSPDLLPPTLLRLAFQSASSFNSSGPPSSLQYDHSLRVTSSLSACPVSAFHISMEGPALSVSHPPSVYLISFGFMLFRSSLCLRWYHLKTVKDSSHSPRRQNQSRDGWILIDK